MTERPEKKEKSGVNITGNVNTGGGDIAGGDISKRDVHQTHSVEKVDIHQLFLPIFEKIEEKSGLSQDDKDDLKLTVKEIRDEAVKGPQADENALRRHLRNIARMAPDILDVTLKTIANPALGLAAVAEKIANKANTPKPGEDAGVKKNIP